MQIPTCRRILKLENIQRILIIVAPGLLLKPRFYKLRTRRKHIGVCNIVYLFSDLLVHEQPIIMSISLLLLSKIIWLNRPMP